MIVHVPEAQNKMHPSVLVAIVFVEETVGICDKIIIIIYSRLTTMGKEKQLLCYAQSQVGVLATSAASSWMLPQVAVGLGK